MKKAVFFDRDGTIIIDKIYLNDPEAIEYLPGVFDGMKLLRDKGFSFVIVTNQSGVPRGLVDIKNLDQIHKNIRADLSKHGIDVLGFYYAPFLVESNHPMRKPNSGMIDAGLKDYNIDPTQSWMVGDRMTDVEAGHRAGLKSIFLEGTEDPRLSEFAEAEFIAKNFTEVATFIGDSISE